MKTISFNEARPGDWLVSDGGSVRVKIIDTTGQYTTADSKRGLWQHSSLHWQALGFHVEREDPPKVVRVEMVWSQNPRRFENTSRDRDVFNAYSDNVIRKDMPYYEDGTPFTALIFPADLLNELDEAARELGEATSSTVHEPAQRVFDALTACGIGTPKSGEGASQ